jgi:inhibitor of cysteine peptidase
MNSRLPFYISVLCIFIALACSGGEAEPQVHTNPADTIRIAQGEQFKISLESNPTTGHQWQFINEVDTTIIQLLEREYTPDPNPDKLVGRGGKDQWRFKGVKKGATSISLRYLQPWDSTSVARTVEFQVEVKEK